MSWYIPLLSIETCILLCLSYVMKTATELYHEGMYMIFWAYYWPYRVSAATVIDNTIIWDPLNGEQGWKEKTKGKFSVKLPARVSWEVWPVTLPQLSVLLSLTNWP